MSMTSLDSSAAFQSMMAPQKPFIWPCWWGGIASSDKPPAIHSKIQDLRMAVGGIAAKKQQGGPMFPVRGAKELMDKLAQCLNDHDLVAPTVAQEFNHLDTTNIPGNATASGKPVFRTLVHCKATVRLGAPDGSFVDFVGSGHGGDVDDKAGGKASTYAWKDAIFKGLTVPHTDMVDTDDESTVQGDSTQPGVGESRKRAKKGSGGGDKPGDSPASVGAGGQESSPAESSANTPKDLEYVLLQIKRANSLADLESVAANIKSGIFAISGADRLKASTAYVARKKELSAPTN